MEPMLLIATVLGCAALLLLPAMITGDWYHDRCEAIMSGRFDGYRPHGTCRTPPTNPPDMGSAGRK